MTGGWCRKHGDVTSCQCRPAPKRFVPALQRNWHQPDLVAVVTPLQRFGVRVRHDKP